MRATWPDVSHLRYRKSRWHRNMVTTRWGTCCDDCTMISSPPFSSCDHRKMRVLKTHTHGTHPVSTIVRYHGQHPLNGCCDHTCHFLTRICPSSQMNLTAPVSSKTDGDGFQCQVTPKKAVSCLSSSGCASKLCILKVQQPQQSL